LLENRNILSALHRRFCMKKGTDCRSTWVNIMILSIGVPRRYERTQTCFESTDRLMNNPFFKPRDRFSMSMKKGCPIRVDDDSLLLLFIYASFFFLRRFMIFADKSSKNV